MAPQYTILNFLKLRNFRSWKPWEVMCISVKLHPNWSTIAEIMISKWQSSESFIVKNMSFWTAVGQELPCITLQNFVNIAETVAEMSLFRLLKMAAILSYCVQQDIN